MKKIYFLMSALTILCLTTFGQTNETKTAPTVIIQTIPSANIGNIAVNINMTGFYNGVGSFQWTIKFDSTILHYKGSSNWFSGVSGVGILPANDTTKGKYTMVWAEASPFSINGVLCTMDFKYLGTQTCTDIKFSDSPTAREISDASVVYTPVNYINGQVCQNTVGIEEQFNVNKISVYPNPSNGNFAVRTPAGKEISKIEIFNNIGIKVYESNISSASELFNIQLNLSAGIYNIRISGQEFIGSELIIID